MPRKSKEELKENKVIEKEEVLVESNKTESTRNSSSKSANVKTTRSKGSSSKVNKKDANVKDTTKSVSKTAKKAVSSKTATSKATKKTAASKTATSKATKKTATSKTSAKSTDKKAASKTTKRSTKKSTKKATSKNVVSNVEYYDLPYRYNETVVRILAQTPTMLFIYWDISDEDRNSYIEKYGENFFNVTKPVLVVHNKTMNYTFEVEINDFANSWYLHVNDADCDYSVELGRRPIYHNTNIDNYVYITTSNDMEMPNNHILFDKLGKSVFFRNVKNNFVEEKEISSLSFIRNLGKVYDIYELYKEIYKDEINEEIDATLKLNLSSSNSSTFK